MDASTCGARPAWSRLRNNAIVRLVAMISAMLIWLLGFQILVRPVARQAGEPGTLAGDGGRLAVAVIFGLGTFYLYKVLVRTFERRPVHELALDPGARLCGLGLAIGFLLFGLVFGLLTLAGATRLTDVGNMTHVAASAAGAIFAAVGEEVLFRGLLFRIVEQASGTLIALLASALLFGVAHIINPEATIAGALIISLEAGVMLAVAYVATRSLWFPIGIQFAWNFSEGGIFGSSASGEPSRGLMRFVLEGPDWLTGGVQGPESSVFAILVCVGLAIAFTLIARRRGAWQPMRRKLWLD